MEEKNIDELLSEEIAAQIKALSDLQSGTKEKSTAIDDLTKLYKLRIEENKSVWDADEKYNRRMMDGESVTKDNDFKERQIAEQVKDRYFRVGIAAAELLIPLMCYGIWMNKGFKFEETGTFTCGISELYDNVAKIIGISDVSKAVYDCRKLSITKKVLDCLYKFYHSENQSDETITTCMLLYGPKADLDGDGYEVEVEDGFVTKGV